MEDDDEFGDLYKDVLRPFTAAFQSQSQPQQPPGPLLPSQQKEIPGAPPASVNVRPIDLNLNDDDDDDDEVFDGANNPNSTPRNQTLEFSPTGFSSRPDAKGFDLNKKSSQGLRSSESLGAAESDLQTMVSEKPSAELKSREKALEGSGFIDEADIDVVVGERDDKDDDFVIKFEDENLVGKHEKIEASMGGNGNVENFGVGGGQSRTAEMGSEPMIPGVSVTGLSGRVESSRNTNFEDDWDSDSEDDLQIVLNDNNHGPMGIERMGGVMDDEEEDEDDEDGKPLVIVADNDDLNHQPMMMEEQEWEGEEVGAGGDGERKEMGDAAKVSGVGGVTMAPKIGYGNHGYHNPFHLQFKYVRPGAAPIPGTASIAPGVAPGQVRPPGSTIPAVARGRGDWGPTGTKGPPSMRKGFHPGFGMPVWGTGASGRSYGSGLEFTLPSHKTIFEVDIDGFEEKPWRLPGIDITDFFNFSLNEESWKDYCKQLEQLRLETTMQSKIRVYESGRTEQDFDPDLPPELAAAAGIQDIPSESAKAGKTDHGLNNLAKGPVRVRPPLPTGRAIQVETGHGDRLPSIDTRKPRISDLDAIIEIVCQDSADNDSYPGNDMVEHPGNDASGQDVREGGEFDSENSDHFPNAYNGQKKEAVVRRLPISDAVHDHTTEGDGRLPVSSEAPSEYHSDSQEQTSVYSGRNHAIPAEERRTKVRAQGSAHGRSPSMASKESTREKHFTGNQTEESTENTDGKHSPSPQSPVAIGDAAGLSFEPKDAMSDEIVQARGDLAMDKEEVSLNATRKGDMREDGTAKHASKEKKLTSQVEQVLHQENDDGEESRTARSSENSRARSESSKDNRKMHNSVEEEVHDGRSTHISNLKRSVGGDEDTTRRKVGVEKQENGRHRIAVKGKEDSYLRKGWDPYSGSHSNAKYEAIERQKDSNSVEGIRQRRDEDMHGRRPRVEDTRKREHRDETGSRYGTKIREIGRNGKDGHYQIRKQLDNGIWKTNYDKDMGSRHRDRDDNLKSRNENIDELHSKRRKEEAHLRRQHAAKEEILHVHRENSSRRKRERDDVFDQRRRDDPARLRDGDQPNGRVKEEDFQRETVERQGEREEWPRLKQSSEEIMSKQDKEVRVRMRTGQATEDKTWASQSREKDEHTNADKGYHSKDTRRQHEVIKRRDRVEIESLSQHRAREDVYGHANQLSNDERRAKHERASTRDDCASNASDNYNVHEKKPKENPRKGRESEVVERNSLALSKKNRDEKSGQKSDMVNLKGRVGQGSGGSDIHLNNPPSRKHRDEAPSGDEQQESRRGRSKLERWTSHKERDYSMSMKSSSSMKIKQIDPLDGTGPSTASIVTDEPSKTTEDKQHPLGAEKDTSGLNKTNNNDKKPIEDRHLDTVEKLKKRSERFQLPMPSEKEATAVKKMENESFPSSQNENRADSEIKAERPARKRRWTSN